MPPNADNLKPIADLVLPEELKSRGGVKKKVKQESGGGLRGMLWSASYGTGDDEISFVAAKDYWMWGFLTQSGPFHAQGNVLCARRSSSVSCLLAGSDGFIFVALAAEDEGVVELLNGLVR